MFQGTTLVREVQSNDDCTPQIVLLFWTDFDCESGRLF